MRESKCCQENCCCKPKLKKAISENRTCPDCGELSKQVSLKTVKSLSKIKTSDNHFDVCENADCNIVYFGKNQTVSLNQLKISVHFKNDSKTKYACYCNKITFHQAQKAASKIQSNNWMDIVKEVKGKISKCDCLNKNPLGECCTKNSFKKALKSKKPGAEK